MTAEQTFFADPALDRAVGMIMALAAELAVARDRQRALEVLLEQAGVIQPGALDRYVPAADEQARLAADRAASVRALMACIDGEQVSKGAPADLVARFGGREGSDGQGS